MKLKELLATTQWEDIHQSLCANYADAMDYIESLEDVFKSLLSLTPGSTNFRIFIKEVFRKDFDDEPHIEVFGRNGTLNKELPDFKYMNQEPGSDYANSEVQYALEFTEWEQWLDMEIDEEIFQNYSSPEIAAHCLWEMTMIAFNQTDIKKQEEEIIRRKNEVDNMTEEEKKEKLIPWEKVKEKLERRFMK